MTTQDKSRQEDSGDAAEAEDLDMTNPENYGSVTVEDDPNGEVDPLEAEAEAEAEAKPKS